MSDSTRHSAYTAFPWAALAVCTAAGLLLRLLCLGQEALFFDEYKTITTARVEGLGRFFRHVWSGEPHPPLYFLIMRYWIAAFGDSHFALRLPSALLGTLTIGLTMQLGRAAGFSRAAIVLAGVLTALNPMLIYYSQEARPYALQVALIVLNLIFAVKIWRAETAQPPARYSAGLLLTALPAVLTHYFSVLLAAFDFLIILLRLLRAEGGRPDWRGAAARCGWGATLPLLALALMMLCVALISAAISSQTGWIAWLPQWKPGFLLHHWRALIEGPLHRVLPHWCLLPALIFYGCYWLLPGGSGGRSLPGVSWPPLLLSFVVLGLLPHAISIFKPLILGGQRYLVIAVPSFLLLSALPLHRAERRAPHLALLLLAFYPGAFYLHDYYAHRQKRAWDTAAQICARYPREQSRIYYHTNLNDCVLKYYLRETDPPLLFTDSPVQYPGLEATVRTVIFVSITKGYLYSAPPPSFRVAQRNLLETHMAGNEIYVLIFERVGEEPGRE